VLHALQAQEQRRLMREDRAVEGAFLAKNSEDTTNNQNKGEGRKKNYPPWVTHRSDVGSNQIRSALSAIRLDMKL